VRGLGSLLQREAEGRPWPSFPLFENHVHTGARAPAPVIRCACKRGDVARRYSGTKTLTTQEKAWAVVAGTVLGQYHHHRGGDGGGDDGDGGHRGGKTRARHAKAGQPLPSSGCPQVCYDLSRHCSVPRPPYPCLPFFSACPAPQPQLRSPHTRGLATCPSRPRRARPGATPSGAPVPLATFRASNALDGPELPHCPVQSCGGCGRPCPKVCRCLSVRWVRGLPVQLKRRGGA
jgi:hypothetical protein